MPTDLAAAQRGLLDALHNGKLPRARLVEAVTRIVTLKQRLASGAQPGLSTVDTTEDRAAAANVAAAGITVLRGACGQPLVRGPMRVASSDKWTKQRGWLSDALLGAGVPVVDSGGTVVGLVGYGDGDVVPAGSSVVVAIDMPHVLCGAGAATLVATYSSAQASMSALGAVLAGKAHAPGRSPVAVDGLPRSACSS